MANGVISYDKPRNEFEGEISALGIPLSGDYYYEFLNSKVKLTELGLFILDICSQSTILFWFWSASSFYDLKPPIDYNLNIVENGLSNSLINFNIFPSWFEVNKNPNPRLLVLFISSLILITLVPSIFDVQSIDRMRGIME